MAKAKIINGVWTRNVNTKWKSGGDWRTDIFKTTLANPTLRVARFVLEDGPIVQVPAEELRRVLESGADHYGGEIWGPFNLNPGANTVNGHKVQMATEEHPEGCI
jgi:hypothetical protein